MQVRRLRTGDQKCLLGGGGKIYPSSIEEAVEHVQKFVIPRRAPPPRDCMGLAFTRTACQGQGGRTGQPNPGSGKICYRCRGDNHIIVDCTCHATPDVASAITTSTVTTRTTVGSRGTPRISVPHRGTAIHPTSTTGVEGSIHHPAQIRRRSAHPCVDPRGV